MFKKKYRLNVPLIKTFSCSFVASVFTLRVAKNNLSHNRYGFIVSKRVDKKATKRNRIKRIFRSCVESMQESIKEGNDMMFYLRRNALNLPRNELCEGILDLLKSKGFIK